MILLWSDAAFANVPPLALINGNAVVRPEVAAIIAAAYDPVMPDGGPRRQPCIALGRKDHAMTHEFAVRVYYEDTDLAGFVYYANYFKFIERARSEWVRRLGIDQAAMKAKTALYLPCAVSRQIT